MSREVKADYQKLADYFKDVSLLSQFSEKSFEDLLKVMHRKTFAFLLYTCEREFQASAEFQDTSADYINETLSDLMQVLYCWCNGLYKTAQLQLRSAIEMFIKGVAGNEIIEVFTEKNVYKVFELSENSSWFSSVLGKKYLTNLHQIYAELCAAVHGAKQVNLELLSAMGSIPFYNETKARDFTDLFVRSLDNLLAVILLNSKVVSNMHHLNKQSFLDSLPKIIKSEIYLTIPE